jgi:hypothetical protein
MLSVIIAFSKFLTFYIDYNALSANSSCSLTSSQILITVLVIVSTIDLSISLVQFAAALLTAVELNC